MTTEQLLREAASEALLTLDGIADTNPRDKADFEDKDEWITWAKSRAKWAADNLRAPISRELHAERVLKQMLEQDAAALSHPAAAKGAEGSGEVVKCRVCGGSGKVEQFTSAAAPRVMVACPGCAGDGKCRTIEGCDQHGCHGGCLPAEDTTPPASQPQALVPLTDEQRADVCRVAESRMAWDPNLSWRNAIIDEVERAHGINGLEVKP